MGRFNSIKIEAKEIYELTFYLSDDEYERLKLLVDKSGFDCSKVLRNLLKEPLVVENNLKQWQAIIVPFRRLLGVFDQLCNLIGNYGKIKKHREKLCDADRKIHDIFLTDKWKQYLNMKKINR